MTVRTSHSVHGHIVPFRLVKDGIRLQRIGDVIYNIANPQNNVGVLFWVYSLRRRQGSGCFLYADFDGQGKIWGHQPITTNLTINAFPIKNTSRWWAYPSNIFSYTRVRGNFPRRLEKHETSRKCVICGGKPFWKSLSYASGTCNSRVHLFCVDCTLEGGYPIKPSGAMICRLCNARKPDICLWRTDEARKYVFFKKPNILTYQVPIHDSCRTRLLEIPERPVKQWRDITPNITLKLEI